MVKKIGQSKRMFVEDDLEKENMKYAEEWGMKNKTTADLFIDAEKNYIKLNLNCPICDKSIFINEELAHTKKAVYHLECYIKLQKLQTLKDELDWLKKIEGYKINIYLKEDIEKRKAQIEKQLGVGENEKM